MSSGGALLQLVAIGAQDAVLVGNPTITFFNQVVKSHTNFAIDCIEHNFTGRVDYGNSVSLTVSRNGDLVSDMWVEATITRPEGYYAVSDIGNFLIERAAISIGGQEVDVQYGEWMHIWAELTTSFDKATALNRLTNFSPFSSVNQSDRNQFFFQDKDGHPVPAKALIPLNFWFCGHPGLALPLIALQFHEVKLHIKFATVDKLFYKKRGDGEEHVVCNSAPKLEASVWVDYVYLDNEERVRFATTAHNYLITQHQTSGDQSIYGRCQRFDLEFNHPVKEIVWVVKGTDEGRSYSMPSQNIKMDYPDFPAKPPAVVNPVKTSQLVLNGHERFNKRHGLYFDSAQPYKYHTQTANTIGINVFSFALKPEDSQPSGSLNFSRIDNAVLELEFNEYESQKSGYFQNSSLEVFATNYNQLRIISGMGGLTFSN